VRRLPAGPIRQWLRERPESAQELADAGETSARRIFAIMHSEQPTVQFDTADRIVTRIEGPHAFNELYPYDPAGMLAADGLR